MVRSEESPEGCIHIQRYNENSNAWHNAQPEMYTVTTAPSPIIQSGTESVMT